MSRPEGGWRIHHQGVKTNAVADALQPTQSPYAQNIRETKDQSVQTRPGYTKLFSAAAGVTDIRAYSTLGTDNLPRYLARNINNQIRLDDGSLAATLSGTSLGATMIPFRPNNSPQSWMYAGTQGDYKKISAPDASNAVTAYKVGIAEQQNPPSACPQSFAIYEFTGLAAAWTQGGTAGVPVDGSRLAASNIGAIFADPASGSDARYSLQVASTDSFQLGMLVVLDAAGDNLHCVVQDVLPPIANSTTLVIASIRYYSGTAGRCVIAVSQFPANATAPIFTANVPQASSIYADSVIASLRRSAIVSLTHGATVEKCFVLSTTTGPDGTICFEVSTTNTFVAGDIVKGLGAIVVTGAGGVLANDTIVAVDITSALTGTGTGTLSQPLATNPFEQLLNPTNAIAQQDDYIGIGVNVNDLSRLVIGKLVFNIGTSVDYSTDAMYIQFTGNDLIFHPPAATEVTETIPTPDDNSLDGNVQSQPQVITTTVPLPSNQWTTLFFPIRSLIRLGNDLTKTLADCNGVQLSFQSTGSINIAFAGLFAGGSGHPDVGSNSPYFYFVRGRNSLTGAKSNPSPVTRYGVSPRRQSVRVSMTDTTSDVQMNTWDVFRYGGTVTSWRYVGSTRNTGGADAFVDNYFDSAARGGDAAEYDNFEPWPTIDVPFNITAGAVAGITTAITVTGTTILVVWSSASPFTNPAPATILNWLPGTLVTIGGQTAYTLWDRPTAVTLAAPPANYFAYQFQLVENAGSVSPATLSILEPNVANAHLPYLWGPDAAGTVFAAGDSLRPGSFYFSKSNEPDSAPDSFNQELTPPSEPILGGEIINGLSLAASSNRWWKLYPNFGSSTNRYQAVEAPVGRGLAAPQAHCTDGTTVYFAAKDGIWTTGGQSLTDEDLFNLFPHEGVNTPQNYTYATYTIYAPDYKYAGSFRLSFGNSYLYFDYLDSGGNARTLVCDLRDKVHPAWAPDVYGSNITCHYAVEQQESTILTAGSRYPMLIMGDAAGNVHKEAPLSNDNGTAIVGVYATFEYNGGDLRTSDLYNDAWMDMIPVSGVQVAPITGGVAQTAPHSIGASATRLQTNIPIGLELQYMGILITWTDDFTVQSAPTEINAWQPMYQGVPVSVFQWKTQVTALGWLTYGHLRQWNFAYRATAPVTITITSTDGTSPAPIILPSTSGVVRKTMFPFTFNKGMLYQFIGVSSAEWTPYLSESELLAGEWGRMDAYQRIHDFEGPTGIRS